MNNSNILDKKNQMKKKNPNVNEKLLTIILYVMAFTFVFPNSIDNASGIDNQNRSQNPSIAPSNTTNEDNYCSTHDCTKVCNDLRQAFALDDAGKIRTITDTYPGSGDYCGY
jgi:hypothetical protein